MRSISAPTSCRTARTALATVSLDCARGAISDLLDSGQYPQPCRGQVFLIARPITRVCKTIQKKRTIRLDGPFLIVVCRRCQTMRLKRIGSRQWLRPDSRSSWQVRYEHCAGSLERRCFAMLPAARAQCQGFHGRCGTSIVPDRWSGDAPHCHRRLADRRPCAQYQDIHGRCGTSIAPACWSGDAPQCHRRLAGRQWLRSELPERGISSKEKSSNSSDKAASICSDISESIRMDSTSPPGVK